MCYREKLGSGASESKNGYRNGDKKTGFNYTARELAYSKNLRAVIWRKRSGNPLYLRPPPSANYRCCYRFHSNRRFPGRNSRWSED